METLRKNTKHCSVGEYDFDVAINRQIVLDGFKQFPSLWKVVARNSKYAVNADALEDISAFTDLLEANDIIEEVTPKYVAYVLPKMLELAGEKVDLDAFYKYIVDNEVDDEFNDAIFQFAMLGFTDDRSEKRAKVKMSLK